VVDHLKRTEVDHCQRPQWEPPQAWPSSHAFWRHHSNSFLLIGDRDYRPSLSVPLGSPRFDCRTGVPRQSGESHMFHAQLGFLQLPRPEPLNKSPYRRPKLLSSTFSLIYNLVLHSDPTSKGELWGSPSRAQILGKVILPLGGRLVSQIVPFETD